MSPADSLFRAKGMTLIELMTVLLILGLLVGLAWPSYQSHVRRAYRTEAMAALLEAQQFMERLHAVNGRYTTETGAAPALPARLQKLPAQGELRYVLSLYEVTALRFTLKAEPRGAMADDACGSLTLDNTGLRGRSGSGLTLAQCWR